MRDFFRQFSAKTSDIVGAPWTFVCALLVVVAWIISGPFFHYSDTWQLVINTGTTIITFLMVFIIQNTQNRDTKATHLKLDELIRSQQGARNHLIDLEDLSDEELERLSQEFAALRKKDDTLHNSLNILERALSSNRDKQENSEN